jgi:hypothetical protein
LTCRLCSGSCSLVPALTGRIDRPVTICLIGIYFSVRSPLCTSVDGACRTSRRSR